MYSITSWIDRRQGRWDEAVKKQEKAAELDPRNSKILNALAVLYDVLRRYDEEEAVFDRAIAANPSSTAYFQMMRAEIELEKGNTTAARSGLDSLPAGYDPDGAVTSTRINLALYERDPAAAAKVLAASKLEELVGGTGSLLPRSWFEALIARAQGDAQKTREAFGAARLKIEAKLRDQPDDGVLLATLGLIDAGLSRKQEAIAEGLRAVELRPISNDAVDGAAVIGNLAMIYAWVGDIDSAMERLVFLAKTPGGPEYGQLKFDPAWDAVRRDPRFAKMRSMMRRLIRRKFRRAQLAISTRVSLPSSCNSARLSPRSIRNCAGSRLCTLKRRARRGRSRCCSAPNGSWAGFTTWCWSSARNSRRLCRHSMGPMCSARRPIITTKSRSTAISCSRNCSGASRKFTSRNMVRPKRTWRESHGKIMRTPS